VAELPKSGIRKFFDIVAQSKGIVSLGVGEPDFDTPWHISRAAETCLENGGTHYTSNLGTPALRQAICRYLDRRFAATFAWEREVLVTVGVSEAIDLAIRALCSPGDEVLYHEPCFVSYAPTVRLAHAVPVAVETRVEEEFRLTVAALEEKVTPRTKALLLNFPCNPTGATLSRADMLAILDFAERHDLIVLADEVYSELNYEVEEDQRSKVKGQRSEEDQRSKVKGQRSEEDQRLKVKGQRSEEDQRLKVKGQRSEEDQRSKVKGQAEEGHLCLTSDLSPLTSFSSFPEYRDRVVLLNGFSKSWAMTGYRLGYACGPADIVDAMMKIHQYGIMSAPTLSQAAGVEAMDHGDKDVERMRREYRARRDFLVPALNAMGLPTVMPKGAFYIFCDIRPTGLGSEAFALRLLKEHGVACVPGSAFGACGEGFVRMSYATSMEQIRVAAARIGEMVSQLKQER